MFFYKYKIDGWANDTGKYVHEGLVYGMNFTEAVDILENYYYNEIEKLHIELIEGEDEPYIVSEQYEINQKSGDGK